MKKTVLINDSFHPAGMQLLKDKNFDLHFGAYKGQELVDFINQHQIQSLLVRSATKVNRQIIENCPSLKHIGRGGVGMDNIDEETCKEKGIIAFNTPGGSTTAVAEMVFAHLLSYYRYISESNKHISQNISELGKLKKEFSKGHELKGKTIGVIGTGRIGCEVIRLALSFGMKVIAYHPSKNEIIIPFNISENKFDIKIAISSLNDLLKESDIISLHIPHQNKPILTRELFQEMKKGVVLINTSRSSNVDEADLLEAINNEIVSHASLDVFNSNTNTELLLHKNISITPHLGASTEEAQEKISIEIAQKLISLTI